MEVGEVFQEVLSGIWDHSLSNLPCAMVLEIMSLRDQKNSRIPAGTFENDVLFPETLGSCKLIYSKSTRWAPTAYTCIFFLCRAVIRNNERAFDAVLSCHGGAQSKSGFKQAIPASNPNSPSKEGREWFSTKLAVLVFHCDNFSQKKMWCSRRFFSPLAMLTLPRHRRTTGFAGLVSTSMTRIFGNT